MTHRKTVKEKIEWDGKVKGLGRRTRGRTKSWILQTRIRGRSVKRVIGPGAMARPEARATARALIDDLKVTLEAEPDRLVTVAAFSKRYIADKSPTWAQATIDKHRDDLETKIIPHLGKKRICDLTRADVLNWRDALHGAPASKNRYAAVLSGLLRHAELFDIRPPGSNPCKGLRRRNSGFKATYLTRDEFASVGKAFRSLENRFPSEVAVLRFCALTGCRKGEALGLRWGWFDGQRFALPKSKTGPRSIWLGKGALTLVEKQPRGSEFVFTYDGEALTPNRLTPVWRELRERTKLPRLRIHDLRHSFASVAIGNSIGMRTIAGLLGYHDLSSTAGYAHLQEDALKASVARMATHISDLLAINDPTPFPYRQRRVINGVVSAAMPKRGAETGAEKEVRIREFGGRCLRSR